MKSVVRGMCFDGHRKGSVVDEEKLKDKVYRMKIEGPKLGLMAE